MEEINLEINKIYFWSDAKTLFNYICNMHCSFGVYVAHIINEIPENSSIGLRKYIPSNGR